jgi:hypothetical protein
VTVVTLDETTLKRATFGDAPPAPTEPVDRTPQITDAQRKDNLRRVANSPAFVTTNPDGTRTWVHDSGVQRDVLISSVSTDRGKGSKDSISTLRDEDAPQVDGLLAKTKEQSTPESLGMHRDERGRFVKSASGR